MCRPYDVTCCCRFAEHFKISVHVHSRARRQRNENNGVSSYEIATSLKVTAARCRFRGATLAMHFRRIARQIRRASFFSGAMLRFDGYRKQHSIRARFFAASVSADRSRAREGNREPPSSGVETTRSIERIATYAYYYYHSVLIIILRIRKHTYTSLFVAVDGDPVHVHQI